MHNLKDYIDQELKELDRKASSGKLSMSEVDYMDKLTHAKKSILTVEAMESGGYSENRGGYRDPWNRYRPDRDNDDMSDRRYSRGYRDSGMMMDELQNLMESAPNDQIKRKYREFMSDLRTMM
jgi:hypothetical protein